MNKILLFKLNNKMEIETDRQEPREVLTDRLYLKIITIQDAEDICNYVSKDVLIMTGCPAPWPYTLDDALHFCNLVIQRAISGEEFYYIIRLKYTNQFVGIISLALNPQNNNRKSPGYFGYWAAKNHRRHGYIFEALTKLEELAVDFKLHRLCSFVRDDNIPSIQLLLKANFTKQFSQKELYLDTEVNESFYQKLLL